MEYIDDFLDKKYITINNVLDVRLLKFPHSRRMTIPVDYVDVLGKDFRDFRAYLLSNGIWLEPSHIKPVSGNDLRTVFVNCVKECDTPEEAAEMFIEYVKDQKAFEIFMRKELEIAADAEMLNMDLEELAQKLGYDLAEKQTANQNEKGEVH